jgi:hypothetical protein
MPRGLASTYWTLVRLVDDGASATIEEAYGHIDSGDAIDWLASLGGQWSQESGLPGSLDASARAEVQDVLERHRNATSPSEYGVERNGLVLLLAYCLNELPVAFS